MDIAFIAGFGPIGTVDSASHDFWAGALGIPFHENAPRYFHTEEVAGARAFAIWPLDQAAEATFGTTEWPADRPVPQAWIEFDVASPEAVAPAVDRAAREGPRDPRRRARRALGADHLAAPEPRGPARRGQLHPVDARVRLTRGSRAGTGASRRREGTVSARDRGLGGGVGGVRVRR
ncbi:MAG TPA: hypothetical protein VF156_10930, partial [Agromyces sp.]